MSEVSDGFGSTWSCYNDVPPTQRPCGLEVVRPGKVQCWCDHEREDGSCTHSMSISAGGVTICRGICGKQLCDGCWGRGIGVFTEDPSGYGTCVICDGTGFPPENLLDSTDA